ncbi:hypothetical protein AVEN_231491-1 [Araneus ventricosus]|uniref:HTH CENPB-type domain-containing protein n=1 Tax=Araneus ventricosus TaxID=182803 RepID=A0A4Y2QJY5_ARAVE|nr:hypothetical protein AVEN_231491-1 [Araneus ventricosus]
MGRGKWSTKDYEILARWFKLKREKEEGCFTAGPKALYSSEAEKWLIQNTGKVITLNELSWIFHKAYSAAARVQLAEEASQVTGIELYNPDIISEDCCSPSLVTLAPLDNDCTVAVAPEENEVSLSTSQIDALER